MTAAAKTSTKKTTKASASKPTKKSSTSPKPAAPAAPVSVVPEVVQNAEVPVEEVVTIESSMSTVLSSFSDSIQTLTASLNKLKSDFKVLEKQVLKEARSMDKVNAKRNKNKGSRAPSGFVKPAGISKDLATFLGVSADTKMARTDVTKLITQYVKDHKLQDAKNGRKIIPDAKLKSLLGVKASDEVTYFNLQKYMKPHFIKSESA
tara:strand:+ start:6278 stop:6895 length:618 start_codon:yes stop_codon:yes gene_type:complete